MAEAVATPPEADDEAIRLLSGTQKCAILMLLLGEDEASEIMKNLTPREVQQLGSAMYSVTEVDQRTVNVVLDEFLAIIKAQTSVGLGADAYIRRMLVKALGEDKAGGKRMLIVGADDADLGARSVPRADVAEVAVQALTCADASRRSMDLVSREEGDGAPTTDFAALFRSCKVGM